MEKITVQEEVKVNPEKAWSAFTKPEHIIKWNFAGDDWHSPKAENDLKAGGRFVYRMESKDGAMGFDFSGTFVEVKVNEFLSYKMDDNRIAEVTFLKTDDGTLIVETFEAENENPIDMQKMGWQMILNNFKKYAESI